MSEKLRGGGGVEWKVVLNISFLVDNSSLKTMYALYLPIMSAVGQEWHPYY